MDLEKFKVELKVFKIDRNFYEVKGKNPNDTIEIIKKNHIAKLRHKLTEFDIKVVDPKITTHEETPFKHWSYCFKQPKEKFYWKVFLPDALTAEQDFNIVELSYVLFIQYKNDIYCVISGSGMNVIKKYIQPSFGVEIYQRIAAPTDDIIVEIYTRSIANNISRKTQTFNRDQTISETLEYSEIPVKIKLKIREDLRNGEFKKYKLDTIHSLLEVGSYFFLRKKIDFDGLKELITDLDRIYTTYSPKQLTLFSKLNDIDLIEQLDDHLLELIVEDIQSHNNPTLLSKSKNEIIELVHPSKLERFYECDKFIIRYRFSRGKKDIELNDRNELYFNSTKFIFENAEDMANRVKLKGDIFKLNIVGYVGEKDVTYGNLFSHITAEVDFDSTKYFKIDGYWYILEDAFLSVMNEDAKEYYNKYLLKEELLTAWDDNDDEDAYNQSYKEQADYYILDKVIKENIELCDILTVKDNKAFFIHVKDGFNTKMRDLYIQVILSAKRLSNDLKNKNGSSYLEKTLKQYNKRNPDKKIDVLDFMQKIQKKELSVNFVMAFKNNHYRGEKVIERIDKCRSNIAKYSLVQVVKEMQQFNFGINLIDISDL